MVILCTIVCINFNAATIFKQDGFLYSYTASSKADLHGRESEEPELVIPKEFNEHYITSIVDSAFSGDNNIQSLSFSKAILLERIGYYAFSNCQNLSGTIYIPGRISEIGVSAFQNCSSLESVIYRSNLITVVSDQTFYNCTSLSYVELPDNLQRIEKYAFANTALKEVRIPKSVTYIDPTAFDGCEGLVISCYTDSAAHQFAVDNGYEYVLLDAPIPTEPPTEVPTEEPTIAPTEAPTTEPTELPTEAIAPILGDADGNGEIDLTDATMIQRYLAELPVEVPLKLLMNGDVDGDGELTISDVTFIQRYEAEMDSIYPIGQPIE